VPNSKAVNVLIIHSRTMLFTADPSPVVTVALKAMAMKAV
jgi:hypothetical protein